jgi:hypothetical protein
MKECGADRKGVNMEGFDALVDKLVALYDDMPETSDVSGSLIGDAFTDEEGDGEEDEDVIDIDVEEEFRAISGGKDHVTLAELKRWDLVEQMYAAGLMNDAELKDVIESAGHGKKTKFTLEAFEDIVEEISERTEDYDDDDEGVDQA